MLRKTDISSRTTNHFVSSQRKIQRGGTPGSHICAIVVARTKVHEKWNRNTPGVSRLRSFPCNSSRLPIGVLTFPGEPLLLQLLHRRSVASPHCPTRTVWVFGGFDRRREALLTRKTLKIPVPDCAQDVHSRLFWLTGGKTGAPPVSETAR